MLSIFLYLTTGQAHVHDKLTIGQVAERAGVRVETIRYYQRQALVDEPARPLGGIRRYDDRYVTRLRFIKRAQQLGFTLDEVGDCHNWMTGKAVGMRVCWRSGS